VHAERQARPRCACTSVSCLCCACHLPNTHTHIHTHGTQGSRLVDGYAPFCKHVFVPNFVGAPLGALPITPDNEHLLRSGYSARRPEELAVLTR
jgi:hypothetical protein